MPQGDPPKNNGKREHAMKASYTELLSPAGSPAALDAALENGAVLVIVKLLLMKL